MTKLKKVVAGILAAAAMATSVVGMSASAYSPTVGSVTGTLYSDTTYGYGTTACSNQTCYVKVKHGGTTSGWANSYGYASCKNSATNGTTNAQSWHRTASTSSFSLYF